MPHEEPANGGRAQGQLERALTDLTIGVQRARDSRDSALVSTRSGEYDQQVQVPFSGVAVTTWGYADIPVSWEHPFVYAPLQRDPPFVTPLVTSHIEFSGTLSDLVVASAHVIAWTTNANGWFVGATVRLAVSAPTASGNVPFTGVLHMNFQGSAYPTDDGDDLGNA